MDKYYDLLFPIIQNARKEVINRVLKSIYEIGKDGDFTRLKNKKINAILEQINSDQDMPDFIGELYELLSKQCTEHS